MVKDVRGGPASEPASYRGREGMMGGPSRRGKGLLSESAARRVVGADLASLFGDYMVVAAMPFAVLSIGGTPGWVAAALAARVS